MNSTDDDEQNSEFELLSEIYPSDILKMSIDPNTNLYTGSFVAHCQLKTAPLKVVSSSVPTESIEINYLPPIICNFTLPSDYPSWSLPTFCYSSAWLNNEHLGSLKTKLQELSIDHSSEPILYFWFDYLEKEATYFLLPEINDSQTLNLTKAAESKHLIVSSDKLPTILRILTDYDSKKEDFEFNKQSKECIVCDTTRSGSKFVLIKECGHFFCINCVSNHYTGLVAEGCVNNLTCLQCGTKPPHYQIKNILTEEVFERYESLTFQRGLDCMEDIMYCPRPSCNTPVIIDKDDNLGMCLICKFAFCAYCQQAFHGINPCSIKNKSKLAIKYSTASPEAKIAMEKQYGRDNLVNLVAEMKSETFVDKFTKSCPKCKVPTQKNDGCNKMACFKCGTYYCWLCLRILDKISPYDHFNFKAAGSCFNRLFEGAGAIYEEENE